MINQIERLTKIKQDNAYVGPKYSVYQLLRTTYGSFQLVHRLWTYQLIRQIVWGLLYV